MLFKSERVHRTNPNVLSKMVRFSEMEQGSSVADNLKVATRKNKKLGCGRFRLELIRDVKLRKETFCNKKEMLMKKSGELAALCDIPVCTVIFGEEPNSEPEFWPKNVNEVHRIINMYKSKKGRAKTIDLHDFYTIQNKKVEKKNARFRQRQILDRVFNLPLDQLDEVLGSLDRNMEVLDSRIELIKKEKGSRRRHLRLIESAEPPPPPPSQRLTTNNIMHIDQCFFPTKLNPMVSKPSPLALAPPPQRFTTNNIMHNYQVLYPTGLKPTVNEPPQSITTTLLNPTVMATTPEAMREKSATPYKQMAERLLEVTKKLTNECKDFDDLQKKKKKKKNEIEDAAVARGFKTGKMQAASKLAFLQATAFKRGWDEAFKAAEVNSNRALVHQHVPMKPMHEDDLEVPVVEEVAVVDTLDSDAKVEGPRAKLSVEENQIAVEGAATILMMMVFNHRLANPFPVEEV